MRTSGARFLWLLSGMALDADITLISDGRFSGTNRGGAIGHVSPEAMEGGPIAVAKNGDTIEMNVPERRVDLLLAKEEIQRRLCEWTSPKLGVRKGLLARISKTMLSVEKGAILRRDF